VSSAAWFSETSPTTPPSARSSAFLHRRNFRSLFLASSFPAAPAPSRSRGTWRIINFRRRHCSRLRVTSGWTAVLSALLAALLSQRYREVFLRYAFPRLDACRLLNACCTCMQAYARKIFQSLQSAATDYAMRYVQSVQLRHKESESRRLHIHIQYIIHAATPSTAAFAIASTSSLFLFLAPLFFLLLFFSFSVYSTPRLISHEQNARSTNVLVVCPHTYMAILSARQDLPARYLPLSSCDSPLSQ